MVKKKSLNISVLLGGASSEREVSIDSGTAIYKTLDQYHKVKLVFLESDIKIMLDDIEKSDLIFNALHGGSGENGDIQSVLDLLRINYTGSGPIACKIAMSKHQTKLIAFDNQILTPNWLTLKFNESDMVNKMHIPENKLTYPIVVKPDNGGSTVGMTIVKDSLMLDTALNMAREYSNEMLIENYIPGREITVGILGDQPMPIIEIFPESGFYDYNSKYTKGISKYECPAGISDKLTKKIQNDALKIHNLLGCRHYSRVDFRLDENNNHFLLELNTLPGMTSTSLVPKAAKVMGMSFDELIQAILKEAIKDI